MWEGKTHHLNDVPNDANRFALSKQIVDAYGPDFAKNLGVPKSEINAIKGVERLRETDPDEIPSEKVEDIVTDVIDTISDILYTLDERYVETSTQTDRPEADRLPLTEREINGLKKLDKLMQTERGAFAINTAKLSEKIRAIADVREELKNLATITTIMRGC